MNKILLWWRPYIGIKGLRISLPSNACMGWTLQSKNSARQRIEMWNWRIGSRLKQRGSRSKLQDSRASLKQLQFETIQTRLFLKNKMTLKLTWIYVPLLKCSIKYNSDLSPNIGLITLFLRTFQILVELFSLRASLSQTRHNEIKLKYLELRWLSENTCNVKVVSSNYNL